MISLDDHNFKNKKALVRVDFNVPLNDSLEVTDTTRIEAAVPTIHKILEDGGSCILMCHLGRPKAREDEFSLRHIVKKVSEIIGVTVEFVPDCVGGEAKAAAESLEPGHILLLENLRYHKEETAGDEAFAEQLAALGDCYVNDAFGAAHRAHASTMVIARFFPDKKCFGVLMQREIESVQKVFNTGEKPVTAILGGAKVSSKITIIGHILDKLDLLIISGGMAFTFVKARGGQVGNSLVEDDKRDLALDILKKAEEKGVALHLPTDAIIADAFSEDAEVKTARAGAIPNGWMGLDIGPETIDTFSEVIAGSKTILWNGPAGVFEMKPFAEGTKALGNAIAKATKNGAFSLVGGGDSVAAVKQFGLEEKVSYVSTGGGAMLEMLEGRTLPGIAAIQTTALQI